MESEDGHYEAGDIDGVSGGSGGFVENDFENLSAPGADDDIQSSSSSSFHPKQHPDTMKDLELAGAIATAAVASSSSPSGVVLPPSLSAVDPDPLISFDSVEDVPRREDTPPPVWSSAVVAPPATKEERKEERKEEALGPSEIYGGLSKTEDKKPCSSSSSSACCSFMKNLDPRVLDLIYWQDLKKSGVVFGSVLVLLLSLALFSVLSVVAYLSLVTLTITLSFRLYKNVMSAVQKTGEGHPYKQYLEVDLSISDAKVHEVADLASKHFISFLTELRRLFLVEDMVDSLKFALFLWVLTYIGAWFNGMTLIIIGLVAVFTLPKVYETYKVQIDEHLELARTKIKAVWKQVQEKLPLPGKKKPE